MAGVAVVAEVEVEDDEEFVLIVAVAVVAEDDERQEPDQWTTVPSFVVILHPWWLGEMCSLPL